MNGPKQHFSHLKKIDQIRTPNQIKDKQVNEKSKNRKENCGIFEHATLGFEIN